MPNELWSIWTYFFQNPVSFALNLAVPPDRVLKTKQPYCAPPKGGGEGLKETGGQGDEANSERTQVKNNLKK